MANEKRMVPAAQEKSLKLLAAGKSLSEISTALYGTPEKRNPVRRMLDAVGVEYSTSKPETVKSALARARAHFSKSATLYKKAAR
jgi:hypothetical protein